MRKKIPLVCLVRGCAAGECWTGIIFGFRCSTHNKVLAHCAYCGSHLSSAVLEGIYGDSEWDDDLVGRSDYTKELEKAKLARQANWVDITSQKNKR